MVASADPQRLPLPHPHTVTPILTGLRSQWALVLGCEVRVPFIWSPSVHPSFRSIHSSPALLGPSAACLAVGVGIFLAQGGEMLGTGLWE